MRAARAPKVFWGGAAASLLILAAWVVLLVRAPELSAEFAELEQTAATVNQRVGSRFGVLLGIIFLPLIAVAVFIACRAASLRFVRRGTGSSLRRRYRGAFALTADHGEAFQQVLRTRSPETIGTLADSEDRGNLVVEAWASERDRVAYVGVHAISLKHDPGWELVEFEGPDYSAFEQVFLSARADARG